MTTLKDVLHDFANDIADNYEETDKQKFRDVEDIVDEYLVIIARRILGIGENV